MFVIGRYIAQALDGSFGAPSQFAFPDVYNFDKCSSEEITCWYIDTYEFAEHHAGVNAVFLDNLSVGLFSFLIKGAILSTERWCSKKVGILETVDVSMPTLASAFYCFVPPEAHSTRVRAGCPALRMLKAASLTYSAVDTTAEGFASFCASFGYATEEYCWFQPSSLVNVVKRQHWLIAPHEINLDEFRMWLPSPAAADSTPMDFSCMCTSCLFGGDSAEVYEALGEYQSGVATANINIKNFRFNPFLFVQSYAALGRCNNALGKLPEAKAAFDKSIAEARRCNIRLMELYYLQDYIASGLAGRDASSSAHALASSITAVQVVRI